MRQEQQFMTLQPTKRAGAVRYYVGVLVAMTTIMAGVVVASLIGLWRTLPCSESDMKYKIVACGILGATSYLAVLVNLYRLRQKAGFPAPLDLPEP